MARVIGPSPLDRWEREVLNQLKLQLPSDWLVIAGVSWSRENRNDKFGYVRDGQADLVVLAPRLGMVVLEVKGSREFRIGNDGVWYRREQPGAAEIAIDRRSPPDQATHNMHELVDVVERKGGFSRFPGLYAYVVVYPQGKLSTPPPGLHDSTTLITQPQMHELESRLRAALRARGNPDVAAGFSVDTLERVAHILTDRPFSIVKADAAPDALQDVQKIEELTRQQFAALQGVFLYPRVAVFGPAGSGKTVLALWRLRALIEEGQRAIYLCFNKNLAAALRKREPDIGDHIDNVDHLFVDIAKRGNRLAPQALNATNDLRAFFRQELPATVMDVIADWPAVERYDAVIIDEGQDFSEDQLFAVLDLLKPTGSTYTYFADARQDLFKQGGAAAVGAEIAFTLHHNCRNTKRVNARTNRLIGTNIESMPAAPSGIDPEVCLCKDRSTMASKAWELAKLWGQAGDVVILSPFTLENSCMSSARKGHGMLLAEKIDDFGKPSSVFFSTIKSFKGIEASSVIVVDVEKPEPNASFRAEDLYVACTRPTARLALLTRHDDVARWLSSSTVQDVT